MTNEPHLPDFLDSLINGPTRYTQAHHTDPGWAFVIVLGALILEFIGVYLIGLLLFKAIQNAHSFIGFILRRCGVGKQETAQIFLELTFPADTTKSAYATEQLHILMRGGVPYRHFWDKLAAWRQLHSLELVGTRDDGIRYILAVPQYEVDYISSSLRSYLPGLKIREVEDYLPAEMSTTTDVVDLKLTGDFALPLQDHKALAEHDPIAYSPPKTKPPFVAILSEWQQNRNQYQSQG